MLQARAVSDASSIVTSRGPPYQGNCRLTIPVVEGCCARDTPPHSFNIDMFETIKNNSTIIKHTDNESVNFTDNCDVAFDTNDWWNQPKMDPVISMESMVPRASLSYTRDYLPLGMCSLINPTAMAKLISFTANHRSNVMISNTAVSGSFFHPELLCLLHCQWLEIFSAPLKPYIVHSIWINYTYLEASHSENISTT